MRTKAGQPLLWDRQVGPASFVIPLGQADIAELHAALISFKATGASASTVSAATFPLPNLGPRLRTIAHSLYEGNGFCVLRGLDVANYSDEDNLIIFLGISAYVGSQRGVQNRRGRVISHITVAPQWQHVPGEKRHVIHTNAGLPFHNDMGCEILALLHRQRAAHGGNTVLSSAKAIYNHLITDVDQALLKMLEASNWPVQVSGTHRRFEFMPLLIRDEDQDRVIFSVDPGRLRLHPAMVGDVPEDCRITDAQEKALAELNRFAGDGSFSVPSQTGDILFVNNLGILHKRDAYKDAGTYIDDDMNVHDIYVDADTDTDSHAVEIRRRWLMRLWLRNDKLGWKVPEAMKTPWKEAYGEVSRSAVEKEKYEPSPQPDYKVPKYPSGSAGWCFEDDLEDDQA